MRRWAPGAGLALSLAACVSSPGDPSVGAAIEPVIFGADDRVEVHEVEDEALRDAAARAMPALVRAGRIVVEPDTGVVTLPGPTLEERRGLCPDQAFLDQPAVASCSATLIDDDLVLTAGHCVDSMPCADQRYVFGWYYESPGVLRALDAASVYACAEVVAFELTSAADFAIVRLDRAPPGPPVPVRREPVVTGEPVSLAGYPLGIPMKVVEHGVVTAPRSPGTFYARLDAHPGNSGSGVLDAEHRVVGELTAGPIGAFDDGGTCTTLRVIGEDTTRTETINSVLPAIAALCGSGFPSERLCGCGDGACGAGEDCPADCEADAGAGLDAGLDAGAPDDAGPSDGGARDAEPASADAGSIAPAAAAASVPGAGGCGCRASGDGGSRRLALALLALAGAVALRRRSFVAGCHRPRQ